MNITQPIELVLKNEGETRELFKKEFQEFCQENVPSLKVLKGLCLSNFEDINKIREDCHNYMIHNNDEEFKSQLLSLVKEISPFESIVLMRILIDNSEIVKALNFHKDLYEEIENRKKQLDKEERKQI